LSENAVRTTRQGYNVPGQFFQQNAEYSQSYCVDSLVSVPSISDNSTLFTVERSNTNALKSHHLTFSLFNVNFPSSTAGSSSVVRREMGEIDQVVVAQLSNTEGILEISY
jgi:hypothetical protein